jgi:hypothetical protein
MRAVARIAFGILLGLILATLPFVHYRLAGAHDDGAGTGTGGTHAHHTD